MSSYYKKINGKSYDRAMLEIAADSVKGKGDGRISLADARKIVKQVKDGGRITDIEKRTLKYILEKYNLTETALKHIEKSLYDDLSDEMKNEIPAEIAEEIVNQPLSDGKGVAGGVKKILKLFILFILLLIGLFVFIKYFYKGGKTESLPGDKKDEISSNVDNGLNVRKKSAEDDMKQADESGEKSPGALAENEYMVKEGDTLIKISESRFGDYKKWETIYRLNRSRIKNPVLLYPGQILILPTTNSGE